MRMPFGKYRGCRLAELPDDYLDWLRTIKLRGSLKTAVEEEVTNRNSGREDVMTLAAHIISTGYKRLALALHPDRGGDTAAMQNLNEAVDWLRRRLKEQ